MTALSFHVADAPLDAEALKAALADPACGACASFEGWVRNHNDGRQVAALEYEVYVPLAVKEGERILAEAKRDFGLVRAHAVHRQGSLELGDIAVWVGVASPHRDEAFRACRYIIDEVKARLPIWKKETYADGSEEWVNCQRCAEASQHPL